MRIQRKTFRTNNHQSNKIWDTGFSGWPNQPPPQAMQVTTYYFLVHWKTPPKISCSWSIKNLSQFLKQCGGRKTQCSGYQAQRSRTEGPKNSPKQLKTKGIFVLTCWRTRALLPFLLVYYVALVLSANSPQHRFALPATTLLYIALDPHYITYHRDCWLTKESTAWILKYPYFKGRYNYSPDKWMNL